MIQPRRIIIAFIVASTMSAWFTALGQPVHAVSTTALDTITSCPQTQTVSYSGSLTVSESKYDLYVRLPKEGQAARVTLYYQTDLSDDCHKVASIEASGDAWVKAGSVTNLSPTTPAIFQLSSDELGATLDANRPSVMLVSQTHPACVPTTECYVTVNGLRGYVRPPGTLPTEDSLSIVQAIDPAEDQLKSVTYYAGDTAAYSRPTLEPFDLRYVATPGESLERVLTYQSGQLVVIASQAPADYVPNLGDTLFRLFLSHAALTWLYFGGALVIVLSVITSFIIRGYTQGHRWLGRYRDMQKYQSYLMLSLSDQKKYDAKQKRFTLLRHSLMALAGCGVGFLLVVTINMFGATIYRVDGHSMESTFFTGNEEFINKLPVTLAHLRGSQYVPPRGSVVILHAKYGIGESETLAPAGDIIKRVIGLPGERVLIKNGVMTVFNADHPEGFNPDQGSSWQATMHPNDPTENIDVTLKENELFISGDNRPVSIDSRFNGPITTNEVVGIVTFKVF